MQNAYFNRIVRHFTTLFGAQKVATVFGGTPEDQIATAEAWEAQLRSLDPEVIRKALQSLSSNPPAWPPALSEWIALCRDFSRIEHRAAALPPPKVISEVGKEISQQIAVSIQRNEYDFLYWAKRPGSRQAVQLLARGAKDDRRLRDILDDLLATDGAACRREDAKAEIMRLKKEYA